MTKTPAEMNYVIEHLEVVIEGACERGNPALFGSMAYTEETTRTSSRIVGAESTVTCARRRCSWR